MSSIFANYTYPHSNINVKDESIGTVTVNVNLPRHRPFFPLRASKGVINTIGWYTGDDAIAEFGEETFDSTSDFYRNEQLFVTNGLFASQGAFFARLADETAKKANVVVEIHTTPDIAITQYQYDIDGNPILDIDGNPLPMLDGLNNPITELGVKVKFEKRQLAEDEEINTIQTKVIDIAGVLTTVRPLFAYEYSSPGTFGDKSCFSMYFDYVNQNETILEQNETILYNFIPLEQPYGSDTPVVIRDIYGVKGTQFTVKPKQIDKATVRSISAAETLARLYTQTIGTSTGQSKSLLPYSIHVYDQTFLEVGEMIQKYETNNMGLTSPWLVDILGLEDLNGRAYRHAIFDETNIIHMSASSVIYLEGGSDGDSSDEKFEELYRNFLNFETIPEVEDTMRYPITTLYDVGYSLDTKYAFSNFMAKQKRCKVIMATQDASRHLYSMDESMSVGSALATRLKFTPESELFGTGALRAEIFGQAGLLTDPNNHRVVPATLWSMQKRAQYQAGSSFLDAPKGDPNSRVDIYRSVNYVPYSKLQKQNAWSLGINYFESRNTYAYFFADIKTIYDYDSSVLSDTTYTDCLVDLMYICDDAWAKYSGRTVTASQLSSLVTEYITTQANLHFGNMYPDVTAILYQTDDDRQEGTTFRIRVTLLGYSAFRKAETEIIVQRENLQ